MFTALAIGLLVLLMWLGSRGNEKDRPGYDSAPSDMREWLLLLHSRQDLKLIVFMLGGILGPKLIKSAAKPRQS